MLTLEVFFNIIPLDGNFVSPEEYPSSAEVSFVDRRDSTGYSDS